MALPLMKQAPDGHEPLRWTTTFEPGEVTSRAARDAATAFLERTERSGRVRIAQTTVQDVHLVVSELVTNARRHAPGPCRLELESTQDAVRVIVWDSGDAMPIPRTPDLVRGGGHGLAIVGALCREVTVERCEGGKRVCAEIALP